MTLSTFIGPYLIFLAIVCITIIMYTDTPSKAIAYLALVISVPVFGIIFYFAVGFNYRKKKLYEKKLKINQEAYPDLNNNLHNYEKGLLCKDDILKNFSPIAHLKVQNHYLTDKNQTTLLVNGEKKFPPVLESLRAAKNHIHIEYYIYEDDDIGNQVADILIEKAQEGIQVRFIYDAFGSRALKKKFIKKLKDGGVEVFPFLRINFTHFANRINFRNHRKIIVVDGEVGYVGGINVSHRYINNGENDLYWRDTHVKIDGIAVANLQFIFLTDWNFCSGQDIPFSDDFFPLKKNEKKEFGDKFVQIISSGPDSTYPGIMYSLIQAILCSKSEILITTPYFIPEKSFIDALKIAVLSGVKVKLLIPGVSDSFMVNAISHSNFLELLEAGVEIYQYNKGFVHAKTMVCDDTLSIVGTANLDQRSFDLNFEVNAVIYNDDFAKELRDTFNEDLKDSTIIDVEKWKNRPFLTRLIERTLRLLSPLM